MRTLLIRLVREDQGQDLAEYALLGAFIGLAGLAVWVAIQDVMAARYVELDAAEQELWQPPNP